MRDRQCDDSRMAYCIDQTQFEQKESTEQIADYKDMTEDYKDQLSNSKSWFRCQRGAQQIVDQSHGGVVTGNIISPTTQ